MVSKSAGGRQPVGGRRGIAPWGRVRWRLIDRALARYTDESVLALLSAAIDSPGCWAWESQLVVLWARALRQPPRGTVVAGPSDLAGLVVQARRAAPDRARRPGPRVVDPRDDVRFGVAGRRLRVYPGDHVLQKIFLRAVSATAAAIDPILLELRGFTLTDVVEVVLGHAGRMT